MAGPIRIAITANGRQARAEIRGVATETDLLGKSFSRAGKLIAAGFALDKIVRGAGAVYEVGSQYVETLNKIQAITGSTQAQIDKGASALEKQSSQYAKMGETASDGADGVLELTKSGLSLNKALKAVYPTLVLAKSGQLEVSDASELVSNTLNAFHLKAKRAGDIANYLANAADASSADVTDLAESFKYVAPLAAQAHVPLGQTNALLAELANSGVKASQAGTSLRKFLIALQAPTQAAAINLDEMGVSIYDATGKIKPIGEIIRDLSGGLSKLSAQDRAYTLKNLFGLTGITGAQIILKGGVQGLKDYSEAVRRAGGASRLAEATSKGLSGEFHTIRAEVITTAETYYRKYSPAVDAVIRADLPKALKAAKDAGRELLPVVKSLGEFAINVGGDVKDLATGPIGSDLVGALKLLLGITKGAADLLDSIPEPIRKIGVEAGIAALLLPRFSSGVGRLTDGVSAQIANLKTLRSELITTRTVLQAPTTGPVPSSFVGLEIPPSTAVSNAKYAASLQLVEKQSLNTKAALAKIAPAAVQAAGIGGLLLLTQGAQESNNALSTLESVGGAAALGFSVAGPYGAALGAAGTLAFQLGKKLTTSGQQAVDAYKQISQVDPVDEAKKKLADLKDTLDQVTGAYTGATRAAVLQKLQQTDLLDIAAKFGISSRTVVNAALGQQNAYTQINPVLEEYRQRIADVNAQLAANATPGSKYLTDAGFMTAAGQKQSEALNKQKVALQENLAELQKLPSTLQAQGREVRATAAATADYTGKLKGLPKSVQTVFNDKGVEASTRAAAKLSAQYRLTPKQIRTVINATGADATVKQVQRVISKINEANRTKGDLPDFKRGVLAAVADVAQSASQGSAKVAANLKNGTSKAKANLGPFQASVRSGVSGATSIASGGGKQVGGALQSGVITGFAGTQARLVAAAVAAVGAAIAAAKARAKIKSPSKETQYIGEMMGAGMEVGLRKSAAQVTASAKDLTAGVLAALTDQSPIAANLQTISDYVSSQFDTALDTTSKGIDRRYDQIQRVLDNRYKATQARIKKNLKGKAEDRALTRAENANDKLGNQIDKARRKSQSAATKASQAAQVAALKATATQRQALAENIQQQKDVAAEYDKQSDALQTLIDQSQQYAAGIKDEVTSAGSLSTLAQAGATSLARLLKGRTTALADAKKFQADIAALTAAGLNAYDLKDITDQGSTNGLKLAEALLKGGPDAVAQMNDLSAQLQATGQQLGDTTAQTLYGAGITAAQGLVDGLAAQQGALASVATTLGQQIAQGLAAGLAASSSQAVTQAGKTADKVTTKVKKKFKSHSPSRVFIGIGKDVTAGLAIGLSDTYTSTQQAGRLATSVQRGFGTPALDAYLASRQPAAAAPVAAPVGRSVPLIGNVTMQEGESVDTLAERLWFKLRSRG